jgi:hypothetical protein
MDRPRQRSKDSNGNLLPRTTYYRSGGRSGSSASPFEQEQPLKVKSKPWLKAIDIFFVVLLLFMLARSLMLENKSKVIASDLSYHSAINYQDSINHSLQSFGNRNKITFDQKAVVSSLKRDYPEINTVDVELPVFSSKPIVRLDIAPPSFFLKEGATDYIVDGNGRIIASKSQYPSIKNLPTINDESGYRAKPGSLVLGRPSVDFIKQLIKACQTHSVKISSMTLPTTAQELDLRMQGQPYFVKIYLGGDPVTQIGQFLAAKAEFGRKNIQPASYLDVRVSGKVFYK